MNFESVLIVTYGRTGSTLLQGVLNSVPGVVVRGENNGFCSGLFRSYLAINAVQTHPGDDVTNPFYGSNLFSEIQFLSDARNLLECQLLPVSRDGIKCWGFKEIRYTPASLQINGKYVLREYLDFLALLMPKPAFVFLTRNLDDVISSGFWKKKEDKYVRTQIQAFQAAAGVWSKGKKHSFWIDYNDIVTRSANLRSLHGFLGVPYDEEEIEKVLMTKHSYDWKVKTIAKSKGFTLRMEQQAVVDECILDPEFNQSRSHRGQIKLSGVVLLKPDVAHKYKLVAADHNEDHMVTWGMPSPNIARKYPDNPYAKFSRFKVDGVCFDTGLHIDFFLEDSQGQRNLLFSIS